MSLLIASKKGKWIIGGVCVFALVATASTGLASWVIGQANSAETDGNINVSEVKDESCSVTLNGELDLTVNFGPNKDTGYVHADTGSEGTNFEEDLKFTIAGTLSNKSYTKVKFSIDVTNFESKLGGYIQLPDGFALETGKIYSVTKEASLVSEVRTFNYDFSFKWGTETGGNNPSDFFTSSSITSVTSGKTAVEYLTALRELNGLKFKVTVTPVL